MVKKKIIIVIIIIAVFICTVLYKLDYKISQADRHPDWPLLSRYAYEEDTIFGNIVIKEISNYLGDSLFDRYNLSPFISLKSTTELKYQNKNFVKTNEAITIKNEFVPGSRFNIGSGNSPGINNDNDYPSEFYHDNLVYYKVTIGNHTEPLKLLFMDDGIQREERLLQINHPEKDTDTLFFGFEGVLYMAYVNDTDKNVGNKLQER